MRMMDRMKIPRPKVGPATPPKVKRTGLGGLKDSVADGEDLNINNFVAAMPDRESIRNPDGSLKNAYEINPSDSAAYGRLSSDAMSKDPTQYYKAQVNQIDSRLHNDMNRFEHDSQNNYATGVSNMAQSGGVDAGNMERMQKSNMLTQAQGSANLYGGAADAVAAAGVQDAGYKQGALNTVMGVDLNAQGINTGNAIADANQGNLYAMDQWGTLGDIYGSGKVADAMAKMGGGGGPMDAVTGMIPGMNGKQPVRTGSETTTGKDWNWNDPSTWGGKNSIAVGKPSYTPSVGGGGGWNPTSKW